MKTFKLILAASLIIFLFSCKPPVTFNEPQPAGASNLNKFPDKLIGKYQSLNDNSILLISDNLIFRVYDFDIKQGVNELDSNFRLSGDTVSNVLTKEITIVKLEGDTIINHIHAIDTLFLLSETNILRKYKGYYFLNNIYEKNSWSVEKLDLIEGKLSLGKISSKEDIAKLQEITDSPKDTICTHFNLTKRQFKKFVKNNGFSNTEVFQRIK